MSGFTVGMRTGLEVAAIEGFVLGETVLFATGYNVGFALTVEGLDVGYTGKMLADPGVGKA